MVTLEQLFGQNKLETDRFGGLKVSSARDLVFGNLGAESDHYFGRAYFNVSAKNDSLMHRVCADMELQIVEGAYLYEREGSSQLGVYNAKQPGWTSLISRSVALMAASGIKPNGASSNEEHFVLSFYIEACSLLEELSTFFQ